MLPVPAMETGWPSRGELLQAAREILPGNSRDDESEVAVADVDAHLSQSASQRWRVA